MSININLIINARSESKKMQMSQTCNYQFSIKKGITLAGFLSFLTQLNFITLEYLFLSKQEYF